MRVQAVTLDICEAAASILLIVSHDHRSRETAQLDRGCGAGYARVRRVARCGVQALPSRKGRVPDGKKAVVRINGAGCRELQCASDRCRRTTADREMSWGPFAWGRSAS